MNKYTYKTNSAYNIIIEAESKEKADEIYNNIFQKNALN